MSPTDVCARFGVTPDNPEPGTVIGVSEGALGGGMPLNGLRHAAVANTSGWYIWSGDLSDAADFFKPIHLEHLAEIIPAAVPYLALPAGWRFQIAPGHEDVWQDESLTSL